MRYGRIIDAQLTNVQTPEVGYTIFRGEDNEWYTIDSQGNIELFLGGGASSVLVGNTAFVDVLNGDDATGTVGDSTLPFKTIGAAEAAITDLQRIVVRPGQYITSNDNNIGLSGKNFDIFFEGGAIVSQTSGRLFVVIAGGQKVTVSGNGSFEAFGPLNDQFRVENSATFEMTAYEVTTFGSGLFCLNAAAVTIRVAIWKLTNASYAIVLRGSTNADIFIDQLELLGTLATGIQNRLVGGRAFVRINYAFLALGAIAGSGFLFSDNANASGELNLDIGYGEDQRTGVISNRGTLYIAAGTHYLNCNIESAEDHSLAIANQGLNDTGIVNVKGRYRSSGANGNCAVYVGSDTQPVILAGEFISNGPDGAIGVAIIPTKAVTGQRVSGVQCQVQNSILINNNGLASSYAISYAGGAGNQLILVGNIPMNAIDNSIKTVVAGDSVTLLGNSYTNIPEDANTSFIGSGALVADPNNELLQV